MDGNDVNHLQPLIEANTSHSLDQCAQMLWDKLGQDHMVNSMKNMFDVHGIPDAMRERMERLNALGVRGIITTNYSNLLPGKTPADPECPYERFLRRPTPPPPRGNAAAASAPAATADSSSSCILPEAPVIQAHGNLDHPESLVFTREGYRQLLYRVPEYRTFLRCLLATTTVLYLGFSFTDAYLSEIRSEILSLMRRDRNHPSAPPMAYTFLPNLQPAAVDFFRVHEGVHVFTWPDDSFEPFDQLLGELVRVVGQIRQTACAASATEATADDKTEATEG